MDNSNIQQFVEVWTAASEVYGIALSDAAVTLAFKVLSDYSIQEVQQAISSYLGDPENGRFAPKPADIVKQLQEKINRDNRPDADEAWGIAVNSFDEFSTVVMTHDIAQALELSAPIYHDGDKVGARMAFRSAYERIVKDARSNKESVKWFVSLGHDVKGREQVLRLAVEKGQLDKPHVDGLLPAPMTKEGAVIAGLLTGSTQEIPKDSKAFEQLERLKKILH